MSVFLLIVGMVLFVGLVVAHEFGHFIFARRNGVEVEEFGIGFPPKAWGRKTKKGFLFTVNWLPLGGFVRLKGEHDADTEPGSFGAASTWVKTKIMAAGVGMNLLVALVLLTILAWVGMPQLVDHQFTVKSDTKVVANKVLIGAIEPGSPAAKAGLQPRDQIVGAWTGTNLPLATKPSYDVTLASPEALTAFTKAHASQKIELRVKRGAKLHAVGPISLLSKETVAADLKAGKPTGYLGVAPTGYTLQRSTWSAPIVAAGLAGQFTALTFKGLWIAVTSLAHGNTTAASAQVSGPVGIFVVLKDGSLLGYQLMLMIVAIISLSLAIMNVLPIPALDGGKLFITYLSRLFRKRVSEGVENWVYGASFIFLLGLMAIITVVDVRRFF